MPGGHTVVRPFAGPIDLGIIIDTSNHGGHFDAAKLNALKLEVKGLIGALEPSELGNHAGLVSASSSGATVMSSLDAFHDEATLKQHVDQMQSTGGVVDLAAALSLAKTDLFGKSSRQNARKVLVVFVGGDLPQSGGLGTQATGLRGAGVQVVAVGMNMNNWVTGISQLNSITTFPDKFHVIPSEVNHLSNAINHFKSWAFVRKFTRLVGLLALIKGMDSPNTVPRHCCCCCRCCCCHCCCRHCCCRCCCHRCCRCFFIVVVVVVVVVVIVIRNRNILDCVLECNYSSWPGPTLFHSQVKKSTFSEPLKEKCMSENW